MIGSVHIPKTAGSSFRQVLRRRFGSGLRPAYWIHGPTTLATAERPFHREAWIEKIRAVDLEGAEAVHGHALAGVLAHLPEVRLVAWVRDPAARVASHWRQEHRRYRRGRIEEDQRPDEDLLTWAARDRLRDLQTVFFDGIPPEAFAFVGIAERFESEVDRFFEQVLGERRPAGRALPFENADPAGPYEISPALRRQLEELNRGDLALYRRAVELAG